MQPFAVIPMMGAGSTTPAGARMAATVPGMRSLYMVAPSVKVTMTTGTRYRRKPSVLPSTRSSVSCMSWYAACRMV